MKWLDNLRIDRGNRLVGMTRGMITLTTDNFGTHTLWLYDQPIGIGDAVMMRAKFADYLKGHWLEEFYR